jgi:DNA adenine methylase
MQFFPKHKHYVEPFGGGASVLLLKDQSFSEVYNDLDGDICNFFEVLRHPALCAHLEKNLILSPYARREFEQAWKETTDPVERARRTAIRAQMGFGSGGATKASTGFRIDSRREYGTSQQLWAEYPATISVIGKRFQSVLIENRPALDVIRQHDSEDTLFFVDPPYVLGSRVIKGGSYRFEMTDEEHQELAQSLYDVDGMVVLSGYPSPLYQELYKDWETHSVSSTCSGYRGSSVRTEVVWLNPACSNLLGQMRLPFEDDTTNRMFQNSEAV